MPRRTGITHAQEEAIYRLHLQHVPIQAIASQEGLHRNTVSAALNRITGALNDRHIESLEGERQRSLDIYRTIESECWARLRVADPDSTVSVGYLNILSQVRRQQDRLLGLERITVDHQGLYLQQVHALMSQPVQLVIAENHDN
jgi:DNA-binding CsgD family transcriptional regulator